METRFNYGKPKYVYSNTIVITPSTCDECLLLTLADIILAKIVYAFGT